MVRVISTPLVSSGSVQTIHHTSHVSGTLEEVREQDLVETAVDIGGNIVDMVTHGVLAYLGEELLHVVAVAGCDFGGNGLDAAVGLHINEPVRLVGEFEIKFEGAMIGMEKEHLVFAVAQMAEGVEERFALVGTDKGVGENDHEGTAMELFGHEV